MEEEDQDGHERLECTPIEGAKLKPHYIRIFTHIRINTFYTFLAVLLWANI